MSVVPVSIRLSIVSHEQEELTMRLLQSIAHHCTRQRLQVTVTINAGGCSALAAASFPFEVNMMTNERPLGFGANHNQALAGCKEEYVCILNPDIIFTADPFNALIQALGHPKVGIAGPILFDSHGHLQDSARLFPTPWRIVKRMIRRNQEVSVHGSDPFITEWIAGMFIMLRTQVYELLGGFDPRYYMYCEDADLCWRARQLGLYTQQVPQAMVIHDARRSSHRSIQHLSWHVSSLVRFFLTHPFYSV